MRTVEEFQSQVDKLGLTKWTVDRCGLCNCDCGYVFQNGQVFYDANCRCLTDELEPVSWDEIAEHYNLQSRPEVSAAMDAFWGFSPVAMQP